MRVFEKIVLFADILVALVLCDVYDIKFHRGKNLRARNVTFEFLQEFLSRVFV